MSAILLAEPRVAIRNAVERALRTHGFRVIPAAGLEVVREAREQHAEMAVIGSSLADAAGVGRLAEQLRLSPVWVPLLLLVSDRCEELATAALRAGISEYLPYPCSASELAAAARHCLSRHHRWSRSGAPAGAPREAPTMIGESMAMQAVKGYLAKAASTDSNILVTGETGTGKELAAAFVHRHSCRSDKPLVTVNCAAIPDTLLESELFGYERGAFTGAQSARMGKLKEADGGTIFLDEIGDMSPFAQAKILRAIDAKEIQRLGGAGVPVDVRIVAATNQDLEALVREGKFRKDLYFRLNVARVHLPPLRERREDIPSIVAFYQEEFNARFGRRVERIGGAVWEHLMAYTWPGNVRELKNLLESVWIHASGAEIALADLPGTLRERWAAAAQTPDSERTRLVSALESTNWNKSKAADKLRWSRMTLYRKMAKYQLADQESKRSVTASAGA
jgi:DNA-binding NtrC family response regulator